MGIGFFEFVRPDAFEVDGVDEVADYATGYLVDNIRNQSVCFLVAPAVDLFQRAVVERFVADLRIVVGLIGLDKFGKQRVAVFYPKAVGVRENRSSVQLRKFGLHHLYIFVDLLVREPFESEGFLHFRIGIAVRAVHDHAETEACA